MATTLQPYGIALPITHGPNGYFNQTFTALEQVKTNLNLLLRTKKGERRMSPEFGSGLWGVLFEQSTDQIGPIVESTIKKDIDQWMPYVKVSTVTIDTTTDSEYHRMNVSVKFTAPSFGVYDEQTLQLAMNANNI